MASRSHISSTLSVNAAPEEEHSKMKISSGLPLTFHSTNINHYCKVTNHRDTWFFLSRSVFGFCFRQLFADVFFMVNHAKKILKVGPIEFSSVSYLSGKPLILNLRPFMLSNWTICDLKSEYIFPRNEIFRQFPVWNC